jgi:hypothetical protein
MHMPDANQEWYTLQDIVELTKVPYSKVRAAVFFLRNSKGITWRDNPIDSRVIEVHRDSLPAVKANLGLR